VKKQQHCRLGVRDFMKYDDAKERDDENYGELTQHMANLPETPEVTYKTAMGLHLLNVIKRAFGIFFLYIVAINIIGLVSFSLRLHIEHLLRMIFRPIEYLMFLIGSEGFFYHLIWGWGGAYGFVLIFSLIGSAIYLTFWKMTEISLKGNILSIDQGKKIRRKYDILTTAFIFEEKVRSTFMGAPVGKQSLIKAVNQEGLLEEIHAYGIRKKNIQSLREKIEKAQNKITGEEV